MRIKFLLVAAAAAHDADDDGGLSRQRSDGG